MKISTNKIRAAIKFMAVGDVREYLCGVRINNKFIEATNGHVAVRMDSGIKTKLDVIVKLIGRVPAKSKDVELVFSDGKNTAYHYDALGDLIGVQLFDVMDGRFPDLDKVIPKEYSKGEFPNLNSKYAKIFHDAFSNGKDDYFGVKAVSYGVGEKVVFKLSEIKHITYGNPVIIIMSMLEK